MMTTSPGWRAVPVSVAAAAALFTAPLAGATVAHADSHLAAPQQRHTSSDVYGSEENDSDEHACEPHGCEEPSCGNDANCPDKPQLAHTGPDHTREVVLGTTAAVLIAAGAGTMFIVRRRSIP